MRDKLKTPEYWKKTISEDENLRKIRFEKLKNDLIKHDRINIVKQSMSYSFVQSVSAKYSAGYPINELKEDLLKAIDLTYESWDHSAKFTDNNNVLQDRYHMYTYEQMLWMLSLCYLLNIDKANFKKLVAVIDRDNVKNSLFEFIIRAKIKEREFIASGAYEKIWILFIKLRQAITETEKVKAEKLVKEFVTKDWYKEHKNADEGWGNNHKSKHNIYYGYWSFETAAVVKIMGLDDSSFIDCPYYPKDLVHQENSQ